MAEASGGPADPRRQAHLAQPQPQGRQARAVRPVCVLVGPPGSGKTTVGRRVAAALGVPLRDTDSDIEAMAGKPIADIFIDDGEDHFRSLERAAVARALAEFGGVLAVGGGAILDGATRHLLARHTVVYLSVELPEAIKRVGMAGGHAVLAINPRATLRYLMDQRRPLYEQVALVTVPTDDRTPDQVAGTVVDALADLHRAATGTGDQAPDPA